MKKELISKLKNDFEAATFEEQGMDYWSARELQQLLGYTDWRNFLGVIKKAKEACQNSQIDPNYHFVDVNKMIKLPKNATREVDDIVLTRYASYLMAQNGDPRKEQIAFAQSYFAFQTRKLEVIEDRIELIERVAAREKLIATETELSKIIYERGVDSEGFGKIRSKGDKALFGGFSTIQMKKK